MRYLSASSTLTDAYQAGFETGDALKPLQPEVVLLFTSITFDREYDSFFAGLYDGLETRNLVVFGGTGDGIYETARTAHYGVCALGITSGGTAAWSAAIKSGAGADSQGAARACTADALAGLGGEARWGFVLADGISADGIGIVAGFREALPELPFVGGMTGDDRRFSLSRIFLNGKVVEDCAGVLLCSAHIPCVTNAASGFVTVGKPGTVDLADGKSVQRISGQTAISFVTEQIGKPLGQSDHGILGLAASCDFSAEHFCVRSTSNFDTETESMTFFGSIPVGAPIQVSCAGREELLNAIADSLSSLLAGGFRPAAAIIISCAGRKWQLDSTGAEEMELVQGLIGREIPVVGFPSFGEIGPFRLTDGRYSPPQFHNATIVICLLGA